MQLGLIILAGGKSSRMGSDKALLSWGRQSLIEYTIEQALADGFSDIIVVTNQPEKFSHLAANVTTDIYPHLGPLSGLHAGLSYGKQDYYFVMSCDMPLFDFSLIKKLAAFTKNDNYQAIVPTIADKLEPLAAIYHRQCATIIAKLLLNSNERRVHKLLAQISFKSVACEGAEGAFYNTNTPGEFAIARAKAVNQARRIPLVSIAAAKSGTGKTTLIGKLLPELTARGLKVAVVKSDGHDFLLDQPGKDTWQFSQAGATAVAIVSPKQYAIIQQTAEKTSLLAVAEKIDNVDLIIIESRSHGIFPIMEVFRRDYSTELITPDDALVAVITDQVDFNSLKTRLPLDNITAIVDFILELR